MTTIINNPSEDSSGGLSAVIGVVLIVVLVVGGFYLYKHGLPAGKGSTNINVSIPSPAAAMPAGGTTK